MKLHVRVEQWPRRIQLRITGHTRNVNTVAMVTLEQDGKCGRSESFGVHYLGDAVSSIVEQLERLRARIESGISRDELQTLLPPGGTRNALDCALWDLEAKLTGIPVWERAGLPRPRPVVTAFTCHAEDPPQMAVRARAHKDAKAIKLKLTGDSIDLERVIAVREALPGVWLGVDANRGFTLAHLEKLMPDFLGLKVALIEQPLPIGQEAQLDGFASPIPIAADESVQCLADIPSLVGRFSVVNIKLDKCGGLTEALAMVRAVRAAGLQPMVGNMGGTSLAMAPAWLVAQQCAIVDLDGPVFLKTDRENRALYQDGTIFCGREVWG